MNWKGHEVRRRRKTGTQIVLQTGDLFTEYIGLDTKIIYEI